MFNLIFIGKLALISIPKLLIAQAKVNKHKGFEKDFEKFQKCASAYHISARSQP